MTKAEEKVLREINRAQRILIEELRAESIYFQTILQEIRRDGTSKSAQFLLHNETKSELTFTSRNTALELYIKNLQKMLTPPMCDMFTEFIKKLGK